MQKSSKLTPVFIILGLIVLFIIASVAPKKSPQTVDQPNSAVEVPSTDINEEKVASTTAEEVQLVVTAVADGDTVTLNNGWKVRYIGMDAPELKPANRPKDCLADEAKARNMALVLNKVVSLEADVSDTDKYDRHLAYVYVDGLMVNEQLVREGFAEASAYPPDTKYQDKLEAAEREAKQNGLGIWGELCHTPTSIPTPTIVVLTPTAKPVTTNVIPVVPVVKVTGSTTKSYTCDCSKTCSQISSCEEAYYLLNTCGCSARDGDNDGIPCESLCR